jgi:hypothetical protein
MSKEDAKKFMLDLAVKSFDEGMETFRDAWIEILEAIGKERSEVPVSVLIDVLKNLPLPTLADTDKEEKQ